MRGSNDQGLMLVEEALRDSENAIRSHPPEAAEQYGARHEIILLRRGEHRASDWRFRHQLAAEDVETILRDLNASAFISAWFACTGQREQSRKTWTSSSMLAGTAGIPIEEAVDQLTEFEAAWRAVMRARQMPGAGCLAILALLVVTSSVVWYFFFG